MTGLISALDTIGEEHAENTMKTVRLELDAEMLARLEELCDLHGEALDETIRICIRHEWSSYRMERTEMDAQCRNPEPEEPAGDDLIPY